MGNGQWAIGKRQEAIVLKVSVYRGFTSVDVLNYASITIFGIELV